MAQPFIGEIKMFGGNFAIRGWAFCDGQLMAIDQNDALFALLGTTYGGDGQTTFAVPDLRGRVPINQGQGPGLQNYVIGQAAGTESVTLLNQQMPQHNHAANCNTTAAGAVPTNSVWASSGGFAYTAPAALMPMNGQAIGLAGGSQPHDNVLPYQVLNYLISLESFLHGVERGLPNLWRARRRGHHPLSFAVYLMAIRRKQLCQNHS